MWAAVPHRTNSALAAGCSLVLLTIYTLYFGLLVIDPIASWALTPVLS